MRAVVQRVRKAKVETDGSIISAIDSGLLALLGVAKGDVDTDAVWIARKLTSLRIFEDGNGKMNLSVRDVEADILLISNFTVCADTSRGNRPSFGATGYEDGFRLFNRCAEEIADLWRKPRLGKYGANMRVYLENDGPMTLIVDSRMA